MGWQYPRTVRGYPAAVMMPYAPGDGAGSWLARVGVEGTRGLVRDSMRTVTVFEVVMDIDGPGAYGDCIQTFRFRTESEARTWATGRTLYGKPCVSVVRVDVPRRLAQRWGVC